MIAEDKRDLFPILIYSSLGSKRATTFRRAHQARGNPDRIAPSFSAHASSDRKLLDKGNGTTSRVVPFPNLERRYRQWWLSANGGLGHYDDHSDPRLVVDREFVFAIVPFVLFN